MNCIGLGPKSPEADIKSIQKIENKDYRAEIYKKSNKKVTKFGQILV